MANVIKPDYEPARMVIEGGGIKRGLLPAEAAVLLGIPFHHSLLIAILGLVQKGVLQIDGTEQVRISIISEFRIPGSIATAHKQLQQRREAAKAAGIVLEEYEDQILAVFELNVNKSLDEISFDLFAPIFVNHVADRISGYDLTDSAEYYKKIVQRARIEIEHPLDGMNPVNWFDRKLNWLLIDAITSSEYPELIATTSPGWLPTGMQRIPEFVEVLVVALENCVSVESLNANNRLLKSENARQIMAGIQKSLT